MQSIFCSLIVILTLFDLCKSFYIIKYQACNHLLENIVNKRHERRKEILSASKGPQSTTGLKGMYRRPSKAIEQGGGFYVPGLEGPRLRFLTSVILILAVYINHNNDQTDRSSLSLIIAEITTISMSLLLFLQGYFQFLPAVSPSVSSNGNRLFTTTRSDDDRLNIIANNIINECEGLLYLCVKNFKTIPEGESIIELTRKPTTFESPLTKVIKSLQPSSELSTIPINALIEKDKDDDFDQWVTALEARNDQATLGYISANDRMWILITDNDRTLKSTQGWIEALIAAPI